jgi:Tfp pilus assembly protein PilF
MKKCFTAFLLLAVVLCGCGKRVADNERLNIAVRELRSGDTQKSIAQLEAVLKNNPDNCSARLLMALNHEKNGQLNEALDMASAVAAEFPDSFAALYTCGRLRMHFPQYRRNAYQVLCNAHELNRDDIPTLIALCNLGTELKYKNVLQYINLLKNKPEYANNNVLNYQLGKCLILHGKRREALDALKSAVNGLSDFNLLFNIARTIDINQLDRTYAVQLYRLYLRLPAKMRNDAAADYANRRVRTISGR